MVRAIQPNALYGRSRILYVATIMLAAQLLWTGPAHAVCEELISQMFSKTLDLRAASKDCRKYIEKNVQAHAFAATLIEVCKKKKNYSRHYKNRVYNVAHRCVEKTSANWLVRKYNGTRAQQLKLLKANASMTTRSYCRQQNVVSYLKKAEKGLSKTLSDARSNCY